MCSIIPENIQHDLKALFDHWRNPVFNGKTVQIANQDLLTDLKNILNQWNKQELKSSYLDNWIEADKESIKQPRHLTLPAKEHD